MAKKMCFLMQNRLNFHFIPARMPVITIKNSLYLVFTIRSQCVSKKKKKISLKNLKFLFSGFWKQFAC